MQEDRIQSLIHLYEDGAFNRRELVQRLARHLGSVAAATAAIESAGLAQTPAPACPGGVRVAETDPAIDVSTVPLHGEGGTLFAYLATPRPQTGPRPAVIVVHENRGLNEHIKDVTRRVAKAGYVALGIDLLSRQGGTSAFPDPERALEAYNRTRPEERRQDLLSALLTLHDQPYVTSGKVGALGFCAGGGNVFDLAVNTDRLAAAVVFYGSPPTPIEQVANLSAPLLGVYGELDRNTNSRVPTLLSQLIDGRKKYELHIYENASHAFHNDTSTSYNAAAACDAWVKTAAFLSRHLGA